MRISHLDLNQCIKSPRTWLANRGSTGPRNIGYAQLLKYAIHRYNKTLSPLVALTYLNDKLKEHELTNERRVDEVRDTLTAYTNWCSTTQTIIADSRATIILSVGGYLELSGIISRVDVVTAGYRGVLWGSLRKDWKEELRMPLLQKALSERYVRPLDEIAIGVQNLDGSSLTTVTYSFTDVSEAEKELYKLGERIKSLVP